MRLLVTGGAGYVGSVCAAHLVAGRPRGGRAGRPVDRHRDAVPDGVRVRRGRPGRRPADEVLAEGFDGVLHFAAKSLVGESVQRPELYWHGNVVTASRLLEAMRHARHAAAGVLLHRGHLRRAASRCRSPKTPRRGPTNPYGASKLAIDHAIGSYATAHGLAATSLRYFNAAGAHGRFGERHTVGDAPHPARPAGRRRDRGGAPMYGDDWPTPDGTCVRDYIHVDDLAARPPAGAGRTRSPAQHAIYNLGSGSGFSVREVIEACRTVTGHPIPAIVAPRRAGDPAVLVASSARRRGGWAGARADGPADDRLRRVAVRPGASAGLTSGSARGATPGPAPGHTRLTGAAVACRALPRASPAWPVAGEPTGTRGPVPAGCPPPTPRAGAG